MKLAAVLACRNQSSRLYAKPLQHLDVKERVTILDYIVAQLQMRKEIDAIVLAISDREENSIYKKKSAEYGVPYVLGDDRDVLSRLIAGAESVGADVIFRITTESPYLYLDNLPDVIAQHRDGGYAYSFSTGLPDGSYYQILQVDALRRCWNEGGEPYRNEYCTKYIFDHKESFRINEHEVPPALRRPKDIRLTVDWPEDLIVMRAIYHGLHLRPSQALRLSDVIDFLDRHPEINRINNGIDSGIGRAWSVYGK